MVVVYCLTTLEAVTDMPSALTLASDELLVCLGEGSIARPFAFTTAALAKAYRAHEIAHLPPGEREYADLHVSRIPVRGGDGAKTLFSLMIFGDCEIFCGLFATKAAATRARNKVSGDEESYKIVATPVLSALPGSGTAAGGATGATVDSAVIDLTGED